MVVLLFVIHDCSIRYCTTVLLYLFHLEFNWYINL